MINGAHVVVYSSDAEADRAFFRDVLGMPSVDAGRGWLIFQAPPAEIAFHPATSVHSHELMLMCDDLMGTMAELQAKGVEFTRPVEQLAWGLLTGLRLPGGGDLALYEPSHPRANG
ncbi:VOC family protein [Streptacidiphilus neutrinimicus]|uniref:VOC family protein n=1 Tax=Streptacidiphilus neutrinimicus TaxID=105420 RepID=UPI0005A83E0C|nr:VOC family protein [Streptacidiphilus neutrinimicus]